jgi:hypothetical protein
MSKSVKIIDTAARSGSPRDWTLRSKGFSGSPISAIGEVTSPLDLLLKMPG